MDAERESLHRLTVTEVGFLSRFVGAGQPFQGGAGWIERRQDGVSKAVACKIDHRRIPGDFPLGPRGNRGDETILNKDERVLYFFPGCIEAIRAEDDHVLSDQLRSAACIRFRCVISVARKTRRASGQEPANVWDVIILMPIEKLKSAGECPYLLTPAASSGSGSAW